jgi:hypothetical protein
LRDLLLLGTGAAVEDEVERLRRCLELLLHQFLRRLEDFRAELHIAGGIDTVHVAE